MRLGVGRYGGDLGRYHLARIEQRGGGVEQVEARERRGLGGGSGRGRGRGRGGDKDRVRVRASRVRVRVRVRIRVSRVTSEGGYPRRRASGGEMLQSWPRSFRSSARLFMNSPALRVELSPVCALIRSEREGDLVKVRVRVGVRVRVRVTRSRTVGERG